MELEELITKAQCLISNARVARLYGNEEESYKHLDDLQDMLADYLPRKVPTQCESSESSTS